MTEVTNGGICIGNFVPDDESCKNCDIFSKCKDMTLDEKRNKKKAIPFKKELNKDEIEFSDDFFFELEKASDNCRIEEYPEDNGKEWTLRIEGKELKMYYKKEDNKVYIFPEEGEKYFIFDLPENVEDVKEKYKEVMDVLK